jgi:hypothetical protein
MRSILLVCLLGACGSSKPTTDNDPFPTFQACYEDHHNSEMFPTPMAIEICCIDHPIGSSPMNVVCGDTVDTCKTYVTANLVDDADANLAADIMTGCTSYVTDRSM